MTFMNVFGCFGNGNDIFDDISWQAAKSIKFIFSFIFDLSLIFDPSFVFSFIFFSRQWC